MTISVQLFALARDLAGTSAVDVQLPDGAAVGDLRRALASQRPVLAEAARHARFAIDDEYADDATQVTSGCEVALLLPVSGG